MLNHFRSLLLTAASTLFLLLCVANPSDAQTFFRNYSINEGLSNITVKAMTFDKLGFLWIGTEDGLNWFDGTEFHYVDDVVSDENIAYSDYIESLFTDSDGGIWMGTSAGIYIKKYNETTFYPLTLTTENGISINSTIYSIAEDSKKRIWIGTYSQGIFCYDPSSDTLRNYNITSDNEVMRYVIYLYVDSNDRVWGAARSSSHSLIVYDEMNDCFSFYDKEAGFPDILSICEDSYNNLWLGTWDRGLLKYNPRSRKLESYLDDPKKMLHIHSLIEYKKGVIAVGSDRGLCLWNDETKEATIYNHIELSNNSLSNDYIYPLVLDSEGGLWIGTYYGGINYLSPLSKNIQHFEYQNDGTSVGGNIISAMCEDEKGGIWIGSDDGGLDYYDPKTRRFTTLPGGGYDWFDNLNVHALCIDDDFLWIGTYDGGLHKYNTRNGGISTYTRSATPSNEDCSSVYSIYKDSKGTIWIGSMFGILSYDREQDYFLNRLSPNTVISNIEEDLHGNIWFASHNAGLFCYEPSSDHFFNFTTQSHGLPSNQINYIMTNTGDEILIGTSKGMVSYTHSQKKFTTLDAPLQSPNICFMQRSQGLLWVSTTHGLSYYSIENDSWHNFATASGNVQGSYLVGSGLISSANELLLGTTRGMDVLDLNGLLDNETLPQIRISSIGVGGKTAYLPEQLSSIIANDDHIVFKSDDYNITIGLYSTSLVNPSRNIFHYKLEGLDELWSQTTNPAVVYNKIPPGKYVFLLQGSNSDGIRSEDTIALKIKIKAPVFSSVIAKIIYVLLFVLLLFFIVWTFFKSKERKRAERVADLQRSREMEEYQERLDFFTMVAHEIRTPASLILAPLETAMELEQTNEMRNNLEIIRKNCKALIDMIGQLLDYKKVENGAFAISKTRFNFRESVENLVTNYLPAARSKHISFAHKADVPENLSVYMDQGALGKILNNLLTNAFKYCRSNVLLNCAYDRDTDRITISIKDDGIGITEGNLHNIFKPFFRENEFNQLGTGIGLYLVKHLVESHEGEITVNSQKGNGSEFIVSMPANSHNCKNDSVCDTVTDVGLESKRETLLIVDDNHELRVFLESNLKEQYDVLVAVDGVEATHILSKKAVNLIVSDIMMPNMDGIELCRYVHSHATLSHIPIILLTAKTDLGTHLEGLENRADAFIEKPFSFKLLKTQIQNLLQSRELLRKKFQNYYLSPYKEKGGSKLSKDDMFWQKLNLMMEKNIDNPDYSANQLAESMGVSRTKLFSYFKEVSDKTPMELMQYYRLKKAASLLLSGEHRISEVAYMVGFKDPSYFTKCFTKQFGMNPIVFVNKAQGVSANAQED